MRAAVRTRYGPPDVVGLGEAAKPVPGEGQVLVRIRAATVNRTDCGYRAGRPLMVRCFSGLRAPRVGILGTEFAGEVEATGAGVTAFDVGDRVFGYNEGPFGAHAEHLAISQHASVARMPDNVTFVQAAAATEGAHYALSIIRGTRAGRGSAVLVYGATGAIGSAAVQLLKALGAHVTAVCATDHVALVEGLGADRVVDYLTTDFTEDEERYDVVLDAVGKSRFGRCRHLLKPRGVYVSTDLGPHWENPLLALTTRVSRGRRVRLPVPRHDQAMIRNLSRLMGTGQFKPVVDRTYRLERIVEAYTYVETGQKVGNVVITVA